MVNCMLCVFYHNKKNVMKTFQFLLSLTSQGNFALLPTLLLLWHLLIPRLPGLKVPIILLSSLSSLLLSCFCQCRLVWVLSVVLFFILLLLFLKNQFSVLDEWRKGFQQCFLNFNVHMNHLGAFWNADFDSVTLGWGLRCCISKQLPGNAGVH